MARISENGILNQRDFEEYKSRSVSAKFKNQMFLGIGGATVFGVVAGTVHILFEALEHATFMTMFTGAYLAPTLGLIGLAVVGIGCLYMGAKYVAKSIMLDQDFQAKKIGIAARGANPQVERGTVMPLPERLSSQQEEAREAADKRWAEKFSRSDPEQAWADCAQQPAANAEATRSA